ncbi:MAG: amidase family protein, partial [bacterium]
MAQLLSPTSTIPKTREEIASGALHLRDVVDEFAETIAANENLNAFLNVYSEEALARADKIEGKILTGEAGPLAGSVIAIKDIIAIKDKNLT